MATTNEANSLNDENPINSYENGKDQQPNRMVVP